MIPDKWQQFFADSKTQRDDANLTRKLRPIRHLGGMRIQLGSKELINFASNDYLGLANDLRIAEAAARAAGRFGWGTGASRLVTGTTTLHHRLELETARFRGTDASLVFGSGYQANLGVITSLAREGDTIFSDALNHASILAACKLSKAKVKVFKHLDYDDLERKLNGTSKLQDRKLIVTDSMVSITGAVAQLPRVAKLCERFDALMIVDDAHGNAAIGKHGRGVAEEQQALKGVAVTIGTYSKALGSYGGFVACDEAIKDHLINHAKPFIYTTSLPLALVAANTESLKIVRKEGDALRKKLKDNCKLLRTKLASADFEPSGEHHILSLPFKDEAAAIHIAENAELQGVMVYPMRYPSVPKGQNAVRISVSSGHTEDDLFKLVQALKIARDRLVGKDTSGVNRRTPKRPTHASLGAHMEPDALDTDDMMGMDMSLSNRMSAVDSSRLPPASEVTDFQAPDASDAGVSIIEQPDLAPFASSKTVKVNKDDDKEDTRKLEEKNELKNLDKDETAKVFISQERITQTLPSDDEPETSDDTSDSTDTKDSTDSAPAEDDTESTGAEEISSDAGKTLAPEPLELKDPIIDKIEGNTKKRKKKKGKTRAKTRAKKK
ncbi:MAG: aminotransferase class I/II-fold pyridoxal phosphate-dependent enzyme [Planctomycetota bacterium]